MVMSFAAVPFFPLFFFDALIHPPQVLVAVAGAGLRLPPTDNGPAPPFISALEPFLTFSQPAFLLLRLHFLRIICESASSLLVFFVYWIQVSSSVFPPVFFNQ